MPDDPRVEDLAIKLEKLRDAVAEIDRSGTKITQREIEHLWEKARELTGDIAQLDEKIKIKADAEDVADIKANYRMVRNLVLAAIASGAVALAVSIVNGRP